MRLGIVFLFLGWFILYFLFKSGLVVKDMEVDLIVFDTQVSIAKSQFYILLFLISLNLFSIGALIGSFFRRKAFILLFLLTLILDGVLAWFLYAI